MKLFPKIKKCPCCASINLFRINGISYENNFKSLLNWTLKKKISCRKCRIEFGLFIHNKGKEVEKVVWMELLKCEDICLDQLIKLQNSRDDYKYKNKDKEYKNALLKIQNIKNQIRLDQAKVRIKMKMKNQGLFVSGHTQSFKYFF